MVFRRVAGAVVFAGLFASTWIGEARGDEPALPTAAAIAEGSPPKGLGEEIIVTGSRIRRKDLSTPAPVTVVGRDQILVSGAANVAEYLQMLPEMGNTLNRQGNNNPGPPLSEGANYVALRSFGASRTLVLLNGRRLAPNGTTADVDLNTIPNAVIERVEILKDGASPIYGADAVAGVVNIITRRKFDATEVSAYTGVSSHGDGLTYQLDGVTGGSGERWSFLLSLGYSKQGEIWAMDRPFSAIPRRWDPTGLLTGEPGVYNYGNGTTPQGRIVIPKRQAGVPNGNDLWNQLVTAYPTASSFVPDPAAPLGWRPFRPQLLPPEGDAWNYQEYNYVVTPLQRISAFATAEAKLGGGARAFAELSFVNRTSAQRLAPEPLGIGNGVDAVISKDNPYNPFGRDFTQLQRRMVEFGPRAFSQDVDSLRIVTGFDGNLPQSWGALHGWFWDVTLNYGRINAASVMEGMLLSPRVADAVGPGFADPLAPGGYSCGTPGNPIPGCVPLNLFGGAGTITPEQRSNLQYTSVNRNASEMISLQLDSSGELFRIPTASRAVGLATGYEHRRVAGSFLPDPITATGQSSGGQITPARGRYYVNELYAELSIPIVSGVPFAEDLELLAAARLFKYSTTGGDWTYKLGARWRPIRDLTLRGTWSTSYRAPSIYDLYQGGFNVPAGGPPDPCADVTGATAARVAACGAAANNGYDGDYQAKVGGNVRTKPETARTATAGIVLQPRFAPGLSLTADYWDLRLDNVITALGDPSTLFRFCYPTQEGVAPQGCEYIHRDPKTQAIAWIDSTSTNFGAERAAGVDLALRYVLPTQDLGRFGLSLDATWLRYHDLELLGMTIRGKGNYDLGTFAYGLGGVNPAWKANLGLTWKLGGFGAGLLGRYIGPIDECWAEDGFQGYCSVSDVEPYSGTKYVHRIPAYVTADVMASYDLVSSMGRTSLAVGVRNVFDREPPVVYSAWTNNSDPTAYDFVGRYFWLRLTHRL